MHSQAHHEHHYGIDAAQLVERYPAPSTVVGQIDRPGRVVVVHGGFWRERYDRTHARAQAQAYAASGLDTWLVEYRRAGMEGGGWPGTFQDVRAAVAYAANADCVDDQPPQPVVLIGHSAGGHLAAWLAAQGHSWIAGAVLVGAVVDLKLADDLALGNHAARDFLGQPEDNASAWLRTDPMTQPVPTCPVRLLHGADDDEVPAAATDRYLARLLDAGADVTREVMSHTGHYELLNPATPMWQRTRDLTASLLTH